VTWERLLSLELEELVVLLAILAIMIAIAAYIISKIRAKSIQHEPTASELLTKFRELHGRGVLTDTEFRTIKTALSEELKNELKDNSETG
jgi:uncharacterized membrane protein